jgi:hypothetical protein
VADAAFFTAYCQWTASRRVILWPNGITTRLAQSIGGQERWFSAGRLVTP